MVSSLSYQDKYPWHHVKQRKTFGDGGMRSLETSLPNQSLWTVATIITTNFIQNSIYYLNTCNKPLCGLMQEQPVLTRNHRLRGFYVFLHSPPSPKAYLSLPQQHIQEFSSHGNPFSNLAATREKQNSLGLWDKALFSHAWKLPGEALFVRLVFTWVFKAFSVGRDPRLVHFYK